MELFDCPTRLPRELHRAVFADLPRALARLLDTAEVATAVQGLLAAGWRCGQLAARVGALPAGVDPAADVLRLLNSLATQPAPDVRWEAEKAARAARAGQESSAAAERPASAESRERWLGQIRQELGSPRRPRPAPVARTRPPCALCGGAGELFVTRAVRLCGRCVQALASGQLSLGATG